MPDWISGWLDRLPAGQLALVFCAFFVGITWLGILLVHPLMRRLLHRNEPSNELIIHIAGTFGLVYAVLLGLLTVATFQNTKDIQDDVGREASDLSTIYHSTDGYPEPLRSELRAELRDYTHYVIEKDWPAQRKGVVPIGGDHRLQAIRQTMFSFEPTTKTQEVLHAEVIREFDTMTAAREERLSAVSSSMPAVLWYVVIIGAVITILFLWMIHMEFIPQIVFGCLTALFLG